MKRYRSALLLITTVFAIVSCGGGGESGDNMNDYWVSAARFANGSKKIRLVNGPGYVTITPQENINIGPDADDPINDDKNKTWATATSVALEIVGAEGVMRTFTGNNARYETFPETQTAILTINSINQNHTGSDSNNFACANLIEILGGVGRIQLPGGGFAYYRIDSPVTIHLNYSTGTWTIDGTTTQPGTLNVVNASIIVIRSY